MGVASVAIALERKRLNVALYGAVLRCNGVVLACFGQFRIILRQLLRLRVEVGVLVVHPDGKAIGLSSSNCERFWG